jgi:F-type H+-transporting ATPase subunit a
MRPMKSQEKIMESIISESIKYNIANIPQSILMTWLVWIILFVLSFIALKGFKFLPGRFQAFCEFCFEYVINLADDVIGPQAPRYYPLLLGVFFFIVISNLIGLIPGLASPTSDPTTTFSLSLIIFVYYTFEGFRFHGLKYFKSFAGPPMPAYLFPIKMLMIIIEVINNFVRPLSMGLRLFINIFSKELLLGILATLIITFFVNHGMEKSLFLMPLALRPIIIILGILVGIIQAIIFLVLSVSYIAGAVNLEEE